ncbi:MAG: hypothetical protein BRD41_04660 [Bacteroidetes bacterium QS_1_63_11]|nr:MAG: hypothetical protein BRD41_04660 [Bacteroidetes bacterium QS_1_63_11]
MAPLTWFLGYALLLSVGAYVVVPAPETSPFILVGCMGSLAIVLYVVFQARLSMRRRLEAAREEAEAASRLKSALLANMSHEVRTPLTSILGFAELIADANPDDPKPLAASIRRSGHRLLDTLDSVLQVSQLESGAIDLDPEPLDLDTNDDRAMPYLRVVTFSFELDGETRELHGYRQPDAERSTIFVPLRPGWTWTRRSESLRSSSATLSISPRPVIGRGSRLPDIPNT